MHLHNTDNSSEPGQWDVLLAGFLGAALGVGGTWWGQSRREIRAGVPGVEKALQTLFTSAKPDATREGIKFETVINNALSFRSMKQILLATIFFCP